MPQISKSKTSAASKGKSRAQLRAELASNISAILANPETPSGLYNDIAETICAMSSDIGNEFWHSPEMIERSISAHIAKEAKRTGKGGAA